MKSANATHEQVLDNSTKNVVSNHLNSFIANNLDAVISDYTNSSVLITQEATYTGPAEIRQFFAALMEHFPAGRSNFELDKLEVRDDMAFIIWHATTPSLEVILGTDTFIIKAGKIQQQTFAGQIKLKQ